MGHLKREWPSLAAAAMAAPGPQPDAELRALSALDPLSAREKRPAPASVDVEEVAELLGSFLDSENGPSAETPAVKPTEELISGFDEKLKACFGHFSSKPAVKAGVEPITEDTFLKNDDIWNALTDNYGNIMPVDWNQSHARSLHLSTLNIEDRPVSNVNLDVSDDEEMREQMDMHSIIVSCINEEPLFTAEQVIEEIEEMMQDSPDMETEHTSHSDQIERYRNNSHTNEDRVRNLSVAELNELLEEEETAVRRYSEELVQHLAMRDELDFEKEVKNSFISMLIDVQNRQKEHREQMKKKRKLKNGGGSHHGRAERIPTSRFSMESISSAIQNGFRQTFGHSVGEKQYLTTVIPYERKGGPPSVEDLQVLTKILQAMRDDSDKVPSLLTDYILKVLCPS
ncbi:fasciculation and elongation protein zeta-2-like isoform X2 [Astyanax mexicanus]|uniref:Fasciculation and elongation protein zeta-2-like isoform X2 n=1 Tax=Astyanax mexicanus TaxID=7994 RepID=A0A8T2M054_ASTMX|nr:fasciculation and elongation protein zeta-2-like isoform X2 [Astyanax mexicanus]